VATVVSALIDLKAKIVEFEAELESCGSAITLKNNQIDVLKQEIAREEAKCAEVRNKIGVCKNILGEVADTPVSPPVSVYRGKGLHGAIQVLLDTQPARDFSTADVSEELLKAGYPTTSKDFRNVIRNTMAKMATLSKIKERVEGPIKKYWSCKRKVEGSLLSND
jgi:hypothetical protein